MKTTVIIQARMGSTRLPGKVMLDLAGKPILSHVIDRCKAISLVDEVVIATTTSSMDDTIVDLAHTENVGIYRGSETNVLQRYYEAAKASRSDIVVRVTSDCPLLDPDISSKVVRCFRESTLLDYCSNTIQRTFPQGLDTEVFSMQALEKSYYNANKAYEQEHVTPYIYQNPNLFKMVQLCVKDKDYSSYRWTVDTPDDYELIKIVYDRLYLPHEIFTYGQVLELFEREHHLANINSHIVQKKLGD